jgi:hypothetical protein
MRVLALANKEDERRVDKYKARFKASKNPDLVTKKRLVEIIEAKERDIKAREKEYERLYAREGEQREMF